jgi:peptide/nickel transport system substrate-binding protein
MTIVPDDETRLNALVTDQVDGMELRASQVERAEQSGLQIIERPTARNHVLTMNTAKGPLADQKVRQAINHAIDRKAISESILYGKCDPAVQAAPEGYITHNEDLDADYYAYDPDKARDMLAEAGYGDGFAVELIANNQPLYVSLAEAMQAQLAEVGIKMSIRQVPSTDIVDIFYIQGSGDVSNAQGVPQAEPSQTARAAWTADGSLNPGGASTPEIEALVQTVSQTSEEGELEQAWNELTKLVVDFAFRADICNQIVSFGANDKVQNLEVFLLTNYDFRDTYMTAG